MFSIYEKHKSNYWQNESRKARTKNLLDGVTNYAFAELMKGNTDQDKLSRIVRVAMALEDEYERMGGDL